MTTANWSTPEQGSWNVPSAAGTYQQPDEPATRAGGRGRPGVVASIVALVELVVIGAACNQGISDDAARFRSDHASSFLGRAVSSSLQFTWRITPLSGDNRGGHHVYASQWVAIASFVVLSALLSGVAARGVVTFWRAFFGIWTAVIAAACVGRVAGALVTTRVDPRAGRLTSAVFESISGSTAFAGAVIGLLAALIAASVAVATRRAVQPLPAAVAPSEPTYVPETPPPFYGRSEQQHQRPAAGDESDARTTVIPRSDPSGGRQGNPPAGDGQSTQAMPVAPEDERR